MSLVNFKDLPDTSTPINASNLNNNFNEVKNTNAYGTSQSNGYSQEYINNNMFSGSYNDLTNKPTIPTLSNSSGTSTTNGYSQAFINSLFDRTPKSIGEYRIENISANSYKDVSLDTAFGLSSSSGNHIYLATAYAVGNGAFFTSSIIYIAGAIPQTSTNFVTTNMKIERNGNYMRVANINGAVNTNVVLVRLFLLN